MAWEVEYTDEFARWWESLSEQEQIAVDACVRQLEELGPGLPLDFCFDLSLVVRSPLSGVQVAPSFSVANKTFPAAYSFFGLFRKENRKIPLKAILGNI